MGVGRLQGLTDHVHDPFDIPQNFIVPKAQHVKSLKIEVSISRRVGPQTMFRIMLAAIDFDNKPCGIAGEVDDEMIDWCLSAKMKAF